MKLKIQNDGYSPYSVDVSAVMKNIEDCMILPPLSEEDHKAIFMSFKFNKGKEPTKRDTPSCFVCAACRGEEEIPVFAQGTLPDIDDPNFNEEYPEGAWIGDSFKSILMEAFE